MKGSLIDSNTSNLGQIENTNSYCRLKTAGLTRKEKIRLLLSVEQGAIKARELTLQEYAVYYQGADGLYQVQNQKLNREQLEDYRRLHPAKKTIFFVYQPGNEPLEYGSEE